MAQQVGILAIGALFGLGATMFSLAAPAYLNFSQSWTHWLFWGGIATMIIMVVDCLALLIVDPRPWATVSFNLGMLFIAASIIIQYSPSLLGQAGKVSTASPEKEMAPNIVRGAIIKNQGTIGSFTLQNSQIRGMDVIQNEGSIGTATLKNNSIEDNK